MTVSRTLPLVVLAGLPLLLAADNYPRASMKLDIPQYSVQYEDFSFPSGLRVIFQEDHSQPIVSITAVTDHGSTSDPAGREGIAHVVEHLWFRSLHKGQDGSDLPKVWDLLDEMGANLNAFTADDETVYMTVAPVANLQALLALEGLRMRETVLGVTNDDLLVEREVVRNELRMRYENNIGAVFGQIAVKLFPQTHPYGRAAYAGIGNNDTLNAITIEDIQKFTKDYYRPENTTILIVGDFDSAKASEYLQDIGLDLMRDPKNPKAEITLVEPKVRIKGPSAEPPPPVQPAEVKGEITGLTTVKGAVTKPLLAIGFSAPGGWRDDQVTMTVGANLISGAIAQEIWPDQAPPSSFGGCFFNAGRDASSVICAIELSNTKNADKLVDKALNGLYNAWSIPEDELSRKFVAQAYERAKLQFMQSTLENVDLISSLDTERVTAVSQYVHYTADLQYFSRSFETLSNLNPTAAQAFAQKYLNRSRAVAVLVEPYQEGDVNESTSDAAYRGARREDAVRSIIPDSELTPDFIARAVIPPDVNKISESTLPNGAKLVVMPYTEGPLLHAAVMFNGGRAMTPGGEASFADVASSNTTWGWLESLRIAGSDGYGIGDFTTSFQTSAAANNTADALYLLRARVDGLEPDTNGRIDWVKGRKSDVLAWMDVPEDWANHLREESVVPNHPYSRWFTHADYDAMNKWGVDVSQRVWRALLTPSNATILVVGNVKVEDVKAQAQTYWGGWGGWRADVKTDLAPVTEYPTPTAPGKRRVIVINKDNSSQTDANYLCQIGPVSTTQRPAAQVLGNALSEGAWLALREQTGASYGAYAYTQVYRGGLAFLGMTSLVQNDASGLAVQAFLGLGEDAKAGKVNPKLVKLSQYNIAQSYVQGHQSSQQMFSRLRATWELGAGWDWFKTYPKALSSVTVQDFPAMMERCVGHETITLVGPKEAVSASLDKVGVPYEVFDWKQAKLDYATKQNLKDVLKAEEKRKKDEAKKKADEEKKKATTTK